MVVPRERIAQLLSKRVVFDKVSGLLFAENPEDNAGPVAVPVRQRSVEVPEDDLVRQG
jgi:hypothetical protein